MYIYTAFSITVIKVLKNIQLDYRHDHFVFTHCFLSDTSDVITAFQIAR